MKLSRLAAYVKDHGIVESAVLTADRLLGRQVAEVSYDQWRSRNSLSSGDYRKMERCRFSYMPLIGVKASMPREDRTVFMQSLEMQVYGNYESLKRSPGAEYLLIAEGPGVLCPNLLFECVSLLEERRSERIDLIYFDSDQIGEDGHKCQPSFRPDFDPELLSCVNYMGNVVLVRTKTALAAGLPAPGAQAYYDFLKRVCLNQEGDAAPAVSIVHIPKILYHTQEQKAEGPAPASPSMRQEGGEEELISVLIPNRDHAKDLKRCIDSLRFTSTWQNLEILILENNSEQEETFALYRQLEQEDQRIRVLTWNRPFNYSAINNFGVENARGEVILLLNNDTMILEPESIARMYALAKRPEIGAVGALLTYPDGSVQHGGIILGHGGIAGHAWEGERPMEKVDVFPKLVFSHTHNVSAVTGACMMLRKNVWEKTGGMDETLEVTFNDVDLCMKIRRAGLRVLMCPDACLLHDESASRGSEDSPEKVARFHREIRIFVNRWKAELEKGDPFYNPNLTLLGRSWTCRDDLRESVKPYVKYMGEF